jgi:hypothetical protein
MSQQAYESAIAAVTAAVQAFRVSDMDVEFRARALEHLTVADAAIRQGLANRDRERRVNEAAAALGLTVAELRALVAGIR